MHALLQTYLTLSWRMAAVLGAWLLVRALLRGRVPARMIAFGWVIIFSGLLLPWRWPSSLSPFNWWPGVTVLPLEFAEDQPTEPAIATQGPSVPSSPGQPTVASAPAHTPSARLPIPPRNDAPRDAPSSPAGFTLVWLGGVSMLLTARIWRWVRGLHSLARLQPSSARELNEAVAACSHELPSPRPVLVYETSAVGTPAIWGVRHPILLFPARFAEKLSPGDLRLVVLHELGHWRRRDLWLHELTHIVRAIHWFNPLVWIAARMSRDDAEAACDEFVMRRMSFPEIRAYGAALLKVLSVARVPAPCPIGLGLFGNKQQLQYRIHMIAHYQRPGAWRTLIGTLVLTALLAVCLTREQLLAQTNPPVPVIGSITTVAPAGWFRNGQNAENYTVGVDGTQPKVRPSSAYVRSIGPANPRDFGGMMQMFDATDYLSKRLRFSAWMKSKDAEKGAQLWMRIDGQSQGQSLQFDNMDNRAHPMGTTDWQFCEVVLDVPADAKAVAFGFFIKQTGQAWVNDARLEVVDLTVPTTNMGTRDRPAKKLPASPANLGFDAAF